ncbi:ATP-binding protein [uncultured Mailhella sp.]|uniref:ATP-binding protein n=1 Tax=uncultured Mailhella sp. TaxID=1981031 RepID=UPI002639304F|nr:ATP-binding protein [uncultured Mailhella sp.]
MPQLHVPARLEQLAVVNDFLKANLPPEFSALLPTVELVAEELLVNVFSYAYPEGSTGNAEVTLRQTCFDGEPMLCFSVRDWGARFNPFAEAKAPDLTLDTESRPVGGLGIHLIRSVSAHQAYTFEEAANLIDVYFRIPQE